MFINFLVAKNVISACDGGFSSSNCASKMFHSAEVSLKNKSLREVSRMKVEKGMKSFDSNGSKSFPLISFVNQSLTMEAIPGFCVIG